MFSETELWKATYPGAFAGVLILHGVENPAQHALLEERKAELEEHLRSLYAGQDRTTLKSHPVMRAYEAYYRRFKKTYHVQLQLESIVFQGKSIPKGAGLVEAMFMAELKNMMLTAGHDLDAVQLPILLDVSAGGEFYTLLRGSEQILKAGDMMMVDQSGIISSILYGPDMRTQIQSGTRNVVFTVYAPPGIDEGSVKGHLHDIRDMVLLFSPDARTEMLQVFSSRRT
jgi:DNA/RNA-binding domain of Phe-tRNA-synthetase-like protein